VSDLDENRSEKLMEQRPLRLGDIVDDYCPRERRITNHAIVVVAGDDITQTRCTACEAEHAYKHAKAPLRKKKDANGALYDEVLAGVLKPKHEPVEVVEAVAAPSAPQLEAAAAEPESTPEPDAQPEPEPVAFGWGHRQLIRAQLPRVEGQAPVVPRPLPDFTIRQQGARGYGQANQSNGNGSRRHGQGGGGHSHGNGHGGGQGRGGRDQGGRSNGRPRHSR
jgi:uncharacterized membrane protein YgcG